MTRKTEKATILSRAREIAICGAPAAESVAADFILQNFGDDDSFLTGSRVYGKPTASSDLDIVILVPPGILDPSEWLHPQFGSSPYRACMLNLIPVTTRQEFSLWQRAMRRCWEARRIDRETAVAIHRQIIGR